MPNTKFKIMGWDWTDWLINMLEIIGIYMFVLSGFMAGNLKIPEWRVYASFVGIIFIWSKNRLVVSFIENKIKEKEMEKKI